MTPRDIPRPETGGAFGVVVRAAGIPGAGIPLSELVTIAALVLLGFDTLDPDAKDEAMLEALTRIAAMEAPATPPPGPAQTDERRMAEVARRTRLSHLGAAARAELELAADAALDAASTDPDTGNPRE